jgi:hypothetical protein
MSRERGDSIESCGWALSIAGYSIAQHQKKSDQTLVSSLLADEEVVPRY